MIQFNKINITVFAVIATFIGAIAEGVYTPLSKSFLTDTSPLMSLSFIFLGAGVGMLFVLLFGRKSKSICDPTRHLQKKDVKYIVAIILLSVLLNTLLFVGLQLESAATASILQNLETVAVILFAVFFLKEKISKRLGVGAGMIILGSIALSITNITSFSFSIGALFIIGQCIVCGAASIVSRILADRNPVETTILRGFGVGIITLIPALCLGDTFPDLPSMLGLMFFGFSTCGVGALLLMYGQRHLGAAKPGIIYGLAPLFGVLFSIPILGEMPTASLIAALILFIPGMYFVLTKKNTADTAKGEQPDKFTKEDTLFFSSISELKKSGMRNYITALGLLSVALFFAMIMLNEFNGEIIDAEQLSYSVSSLCMVLGISVLLCGIALLFLGKRVLAAVTFILMSSQIFAMGVFSGTAALNVLSSIFSFLFAGILLTSKNPQKYAYALVNVLLGVASLSCLFNNTVSGCIMAAAVAFLIWLSITCGTGKLRFSFSKYLIEDNSMTFGKCGATVALLLFAKMIVSLIIYVTAPQLFGGIPEDVLLNFTLINPVLIILVGILLMFVGKRQMTAVYFIGMGIAFCLDLFTVGILQYLSAFLLLTVGILTILRNSTLILPASVVTGGSFTTMLYCQAPAFPEIETVMLLMYIAMIIIAIYLSFAVFAEKTKLPLF